jgi:hypothetical protein
VPDSSCGLATVAGLPACLLFVARRRWPHAGRLCLLAPRPLLHCRLWSRRMCAVPRSGQHWPPAYRVGWPAALSHLRGCVLTQVDAAAIAAGSTRRRPALRSLVLIGYRICVCRCSLVVWPRPQRRCDAALRGLPLLAAIGEPRSGSALASCASRHGPPLSHRLCTCSRCHHQARPPRFKAPHHRAHPHALPRDVASAWAPRPPFPVHLALVPQPISSH